MASSKRIFVVLTTILILGASADDPHQHSGSTVSNNYNHQTKVLPLSFANRDQESNLGNSHLAGQNGFYQPTNSNLDSGGYQPQFINSQNPQKSLSINSQEYNSNAKSKYQTTEPNMEANRENAASTVGKFKIIHVPFEMRSKEAKTLELDLPTPNIAKYNVEPQNRQPLEKRIPEAVLKKTKLADEDAARILNYKRRGDYQENIPQVDSINEYQNKAKDIYATGNINQNEDKAYVYNEYDANKATLPTNVRYSLEKVENEIDEILAYGKDNGNSQNALKTIADDTKIPSNTYTRNNKPATTYLPNLNLPIYKNYQGAPLSTSRSFQASASASSNAGTRAEYNSQGNLNYPRFPTFELSKSSPFERKAKDSPTHRTTNVQNYIHPLSTTYDRWNTPASAIPLSSTHYGTGSQSYTISPFTSSNVPNGYEIDNKKMYKLPVSFNNQNDNVQHNVNYQGPTVLPKYPSLNWYHDFQASNQLPSTYQSTTTESLDERNVNNEQATFTSRNVLYSAPHLLPNTGSNNPAYNSPFPANTDGPQQFPPQDVNKETYYWKHHENKPYGIATAESSAIASSQSGISSFSQSSPNYIPNLYGYNNVHISPHIWQNQPPYPILPQTDTGSVNKYRVPHNFPGVTKNDYTWNTPFNNAFSYTNDGNKQLLTSNTNKGTTDWKFNNNKNNAPTKLDELPSTSVSFTTENTGNTQTGLGNTPFNQIRINPKQPYRGNYPQNYRNKPDFIIPRPVYSFNNGNPIFSTQTRSENIKDSAIPGSQSIGWNTPTFNTDINYDKIRGTSSLQKYENNDIYSIKQSEDADKLTESDSPQAINSSFQDSPKNPFIISEGGDTKTQTPNDNYNIYGNIDNSLSNPTPTESKPVTNSQVDSRSSENTGLIDEWNASTENVPISYISDDIQLQAPISSKKYYGDNGPSILYSITTLPPTTTTPESQTLSYIPQQNNLYPYHYNVYGGNYPRRTPPTWQNYRFNKIQHQVRKRPNYIKNDGTVPFGQTQKYKSNNPSISTTNINDSSQQYPIVAIKKATNETQHETNASQEYENNENNPTKQIENEDKSTAGASSVAGNTSSPDTTKNAPSTSYSSDGAKSDQTPINNSNNFESNDNGLSHSDVAESKPATDSQTGGKNPKNTGDFDEWNSSTENVPTSYISDRLQAQSPIGSKKYYGDNGPSILYSITTAAPTTTTPYSQTVSYIPQQNNLYPHHYNLYNRNYPRHSAPIWQNYQINKIHNQVRKRPNYVKNDGTVPVRQTQTYNWNNPSVSAPNINDSPQQYPLDATKKATNEIQHYLFSEKKNETSASQEYENNDSNPIKQIEDEDKPTAGASSVAENTSSPDTTENASSTSYSSDAAKSDQSPIDNFNNYGSNDNGLSHSDAAKSKPASDSQTDGKTPKNTGDFDEWNSSSENVPTSYISDHLQAPSPLGSKKYYGDNGPSMLYSITTSPPTTTTPYSQTVSYIPQQNYVYPDHYNLYEGNYQRHTTPPNWQKYRFNHIQHPAYKRPRYVENDSPVPFRETQIYKWNNPYDRVSTTKIYDSSQSLHLDATNKRTEETEHYLFNGKNNATGGSEDYENNDINPINQIEDADIPIASVSSQAGNTNSQYISKEAPSTSYVGDDIKSQTPIDNSKYYENIDNGASNSDVVESKPVVNSETDGTKPENTGFTNKWISFTEDSPASYTNDDLQTQSPLSGLVNSDDNISSTTTTSDTRSAHYIPQQYNLYPYHHNLYRENYPRHTPPNWQNYVHRFNPIYYPADYSPNYLGNSGTVQFGPTHTQSWNNPSNIAYSTNSNERDQLYRPDTTNKGVDDTQNYGYKSNNYPNPDTTAQVESSAFSQSYITTSSPRDYGTTDSYTNKGNPQTQPSIDKKYDETNGNEDEKDFKLISKVNKTDSTESTISSELKAENNQPKDYQHYIDRHYGGRYHPKFKPYQTYGHQSTFIQPNAYKNTQIQPSAMNSNYKLNDIKNSENYNLPAKFDKIELPESTTSAPKTQTNESELTISDQENDYLYDDGDTFGDQSSYRRKSQPQQKQFYSPYDINRESNDQSGSENDEPDLERSSKNEWNYSASAPSTANDKTQVQYPVPETGDDTDESNYNENSTSSSSQTEINESQDISWYNRHKKRGYRSRQSNKRKENGEQLSDSQTQSTDSLFDRYLDYNYSSGQNTDEKASEYSYSKTTHGQKQSSKDSTGLNQQAQPPYDEDYDDEDKLTIVSQSYNTAKENNKSKLLTDKNYIGTVDTKADYYLETGKINLGNEVKLDQTTSKIAAQSYKTTSAKTVKSEKSYSEKIIESDKTNAQKTITSDNTASLKPVKSDKTNFDRTVKSDKTNTVQNDQYSRAEGDKTVKEKHTSSHIVKENAENSSSTKTSTKKSGTSAKVTSQFSYTSNADSSYTRTVNALLKILDSIEKLFSGGCNDNKS